MRIRPRAVILVLAVLAGAWGLHTWSGLQRHRRATFRHEKGAPVAVVGWLGRTKAEMVEIHAGPAFARRLLKQLQDERDGPRTLCAVMGSVTLRFEDGHERAMLLGCCSAFGNGVYVQCEPGAMEALIQEYLSDPTVFGDPPLERPDASPGAPAR